MKYEDMTPEEKKIQKLLNKIMSEEMLAYMLYMGCVASAKDHESVANFEELMKENAKDELEDHFMHLKDFARANDFEIPFKFKDYLKYAEKQYKQIDNLKKDQDVSYYIDQAIISEQDAIASYEEALALDFVPYELTTILSQNYYDECDHLQSLMTLKYAVDAGVALIAY